MLPSLTKELPCCSLCPQTSFPDWCFCGFPQTFLANALISEIRPWSLPSTVLPIKCHWTHHQRHHMSESPLSTRHGTHFNHGWMTRCAVVEDNCECYNNAVVDRRKSWPPEHKTDITECDKGSWTWMFSCTITKVDPPPPRADVKKEWKYASTPAIHLYVVGRQNFTLIQWNKICTPSDNLKMVVHNNYMHQQF